jgi:hypothetical protein
MTPRFLELSLLRDRAEARRLIDAIIPDEWPDEVRWVRRRLDQLRADPSLQPWLLQAIVLRSE